MEGELPEALLSKRRSQLTHSHERAAAAHPPVSLSEGLSRLSLSANTRYGSRRASSNNNHDDARSDITSMVSVASTRPGAHPLAHHWAHMPPRSQGYASSTAANTARYVPSS